MPPSPCGVRRGTATAVPSIFKDLVHTTRQGSYIMSFTSTGSGKVYRCQPITAKKDGKVLGHSITLNGSDKTNAYIQIWKGDFSDKDYPITDNHTKQNWTGQTSPYTLHYTDCPITTYNYTMNITLKPQKFELQG